LPGTGVGFIPSESTGELNVIDTVNLNVLKVITLPPGSRPMSVKVAPNGRKVYISNGRAGTVSVLDSRSYELLNTIKVGVRPWGWRFHPTEILVHGQRTLERMYPSSISRPTRKSRGSRQARAPGRWLSRPIRIERRIWRADADHFPMMNTSCA